MKKFLIWGLVLCLIAVSVPVPLAAQEMPPLPRTVPLPGTVSPPSETVLPPQTVPPAPLPSVTRTAPPPPPLPSGEAILADTLIVRPMGIAACIIGLAGSIIAFPFAALSNSQGRVTQRLLVEPFDYTFRRPLGEEGR